MGRSHVASFRSCSIPLEPLVERPLDYSSEGLVVDPSFRAQLLGRLAHVGTTVLEAFGSEQDIEGCVDAAGQLYVVQARPQVLKATA